MLLKVCACAFSTCPNHNLLDFYDSQDRVVHQVNQKNHFYHRSDDFSNNIFVFLY